MVGHLRFPDPRTSGWPAYPLTELRGIAQVNRRDHQFVALYDRCSRMPELPAVIGPVEPHADETFEELIHSPGQAILVRGADVDAARGGADVEPFEWDLAPVERLISD